MTKTMKLAALLTAAVMITLFSFRKLSPIDSAPIVNPAFCSDYEFLWSILETEYPLWGVAERVTGKDFSAVKEEYRQRLETPGYANTPEQFFEKIVVPCLREFGYTGHLQAISHQDYDDQYSILKQTIDHGEALLPYGKHNWDTFNEPQVRAFYTDMTVPKQPVAKPQGEAKHDSNLSFQYFPNKSAAYVSMKRMTQPNENDDEQTLADFFKEINRQGYQHCILDIRGNEGGSDMYWMDNIVVPNLKKPLYKTYYALIKGEKAGKYLEKNKVAIFPIAELSKSDFPRLNQQDYLEAHSYVAQTHTVDTARKGGDGAYAPLFEGDFWLLVDDSVYSSAESFAVFCKQNDFARLVGTPTGGDGGGYAPMVMSLPETGICFRFSAGNGLNSDGSSNEEFGTQPDILIGDDEDALKRCLDDIR